MEGKKGEIFICGFGETGFLRTFVCWMISFRRDCDRDPIGLDAKTAAGPGALLYDCNQGDFEGEAFHGLVLLL
jgi:hypothetical protein